MTDENIPGGVVRVADDWKVTPWHGGPNPPADWNGQAVLFRNGAWGNPMASSDRWMHPFKRPGYRGLMDIVGYVSTALPKSVIEAAQGIEARSDTTRSGVAVGESPVANGDAPGTSPHPHPEGSSH